VELLVLGAAGGVGTQAVVAALAAGHRVRAGSRAGSAAPDGAVPLAVDVRDLGAVARAVDGVDAVLWCVGVTRGSGPDVGRVGMPHLVAAASSSTVSRVVTVSGAGVTLPGDAKGPGVRAVSALTRRLAHDLVADKEGEHAVLAASSLSWTEVRPPRLREAPGTGRWRLTEAAPGLTARPLAKADVAAAMVSLAVDGGWEGRSPFVVAG
jgi:putative NADH-flavin reductase